LSKLKWLDSNPDRIGGNKMKAMNMLPKLVSTIFFCFLVALQANTQAGLFGDSVKFADLTKLSPEGLEALKEPEYGVFLARVELARAEEAKKRAEQVLSSARRALEVEQLELKAVKAEEKAAKEDHDTDRMYNAGVALIKAQEDVKVANLLVNWKMGIVKARKAGVKKAKSSLELAESKRDLARVTQLAAEKVPSAQKYSLDEYQERVKKKQEEFDKAGIKEKNAVAEAEKAQDEYEQWPKTEPGTE
jgi:hypothetical protein